MNKKILLGLLFLTLAWAPASHAAKFITSEETALTTENVFSDLFITGNDVTVGHAVDQDLFAAGNAISVNGPVNQDTTVAGNIVKVTGEVGDDIMAAGNRVEITSPSSEDIFSAGNMVEINVNQINGSVYTAGNIINLKGNIAGNVYTAGNKVTIKNGTTIKGDFKSYGDIKPTIEDGVVINGSVSHQVLDDSTKHKDRNAIARWVFNVITIFLLSLVLFYLMPGFTQNVITKSLIKSGRSLGIGFLWLISFIPAVILLMITAVGWPLAFLVIFITLTELITAVAYASVIVGVWTMQKVFKKQIDISWQHLLLGVVIINIIKLIPVLGWLISLVITLVALGAVGQTLWHILRKPAQADIPTSS